MPIEAATQAFEWQASAVERAGAGVVQLKAAGDGIRLAFVRPDRRLQRQAGARGTVDPDSRINLDEFQARFGERLAGKGRQQHPAAPADAFCRGNRKFDAFERTGGLERQPHRLVVDLAGDAGLRPQG